MSAEASILLLNSLVILLGYLVIYPKTAGNDFYKITYSDICASATALTIVGYKYWELEQKFNLVVIEVNWFWFTLISYALLEIPIMLWYFKKHQVKIPK